MLIAAASPSVGFKGERLEREDSDRSPNAEYPWQADADDADSCVWPASQSFAAVHTLRYNKHAISAFKLLNKIVEVANSGVLQG